ncbi:hypothetical protein T06_12022 [Trichinella sp. T6]|nr:hypothetical protein T06_12022 [Trichinella sp. T6]
MPFTSAVARSTAQTSPATSRSSRTPLKCSVVALRLLQRPHYVHSHSLEGLTEWLKLQSSLSFFSGAACSAHV